jgi:hypothetical protein
MTMIYKEDDDGWRWYEGMSTSEPWGGPFPTKEEAIHDMIFASPMMVASIEGAAKAARALAELPPDADEDATAEAESNAGMYLAEAMWPDINHPNQDAIADAVYTELAVRVGGEVLHAAFEHCGRLLNEEVSLNLKVEALRKARR